MKFLPPLLALSGLFLLQRAAYGEAQYISSEVPVLHQAPKAAFALPEKFRDYLKVCANSTPLLEIIDRSATSALKDSGFGIVEDLVQSENNTLKLRYAFDPVSELFLNDYNRAVSRNRQLETTKLYSMELTINFTILNSQVKADSIVNVFYYLGKQRREYDGPWDGRKIYSQVIEKIFSAVSALSCQ